MDLKKYKLLKETSGAFHIHDGDNHFQVAKRGLGQETLKQIRDHFDCGGEVKKYADGGPVDSKTNPSQRFKKNQIKLESSETEDQTANRNRSNENLARELATRSAATPALDIFWGRHSGYANGGEVDDGSWSVGGALSSLAHGMGFGNPSPDDVRMQRAANTPAPQPVDPAAQLLGTASKTDAPTPPAPALQSGPTQQIPDGPPAPPPGAPGMQPPALPALGGGGGGDLDAALVKAQKEGDEAITKEAQIKGAISSANTSLLDQSIQEQTQREAARKAQFDHAQQQSDEAQEFVRQNPVRADKYWHDKTVPQKVSGIIGMILGGLSGGMTGHENPVAVMIDRAIERDVAAQKENLNSAQNRVAYFMKKGHDINESAQLAALEARDVLHAKLEATAAQSGNAMAIAEGQRARSDNDIKTTATRSQLMDQKLQRDRLQWEMKVQAQQSQQSMVQQYMARMFDTSGVDANARWLLPKEMQERGVFTPDGKFRGVASSKDAEKHKEAMMPLHAMDANLSRLDQLYEAGTHAPWSISNRTEASQIANELQLSLHNLTGVNRVNETELKEIFPAIISDPSKLLTPGYMAKIKGLSRMIDNQKMAINKTYFGPK